MEEVSDPKIQQTDFNSQLATMLADPNKQDRIDEKDDSKIKNSHWKSKVG